MHFLNTLTLLATALSLVNAQTRITVNPSTRYQEIDGFGFSAAFQRANLLIALQQPRQQEVLDLLFNTTNGAGFSILRNGIGSSPDSSSDYMNTILPKNPGGPNATPNYVWDGKDSGQLWLSQQAVRYGVQTIYANAWSAPGFMKTNGDDRNGGSLCGSPGASCGSGDWRQRYADYLVQYIKFYAQDGVNITHLGFLNEPDLSTSYASMRANAQQATDFIRILSPTLQRNNLTHVKINCCEATGWQVTQSQYLSGLASVNSMLGVITTHTYTSGIGGRLNTQLKTWQSEYSDLQGQWTTTWFQSGGSGDGYTWANTLHTAMTTGNLNGYLWWEGVQWPNPNTNEKLIRIDGQNYQVSKRLWAFAQYSRNIRPGAFRIDAQGGGSLRVTAYENKDGRIAVLALNTGTSAVNVVIAGIRAASVQSWVTDNTRDMVLQAATIATDGTVSGSIPNRGLVSFLITRESA